MCMTSPLPRPPSRLNSPEAGQGPRRQHTEPPDTVTSQSRGQVQRGSLVSLRLLPWLWSHSPAAIIPKQNPVAPPCEAGSSLKRASLLWGRCCRFYRTANSPFRSAVANSNAPRSSRATWRVRRGLEARGEDGRAPQGVCSDQGAAPAGVTTPPPHGKVGLTQHNAPGPPENLGREPLIQSQTSEAAEVPVP